MSLIVFVTSLIIYTAGWNVWMVWFLAVNHQNHKNWVPSILTHNLWLIFIGMKQKKNVFLKKIQNGRLKKTSHQSILLIQGPIHEIFTKKYWALAILKNSVFLTRPFWFFLLHFHENQSKVHFDECTSFQPKITSPNISATSVCTAPICPNCVKHLLNLELTNSSWTV